MIDELESQLGIKIPRDFDEETNNVLIEACGKHNVKCNPPQRTARLLDKVSS